MASLVYNSYAVDVFNGQCKTSDPYKALMTTASYIENRATHTRLSDITSEVTGTGYSAGGVSVSLSVAINNTTNILTLTVGSAEFTDVTVTSRKLIVYRFRTGQAASAQELVCCNDNFVDFISEGNSIFWPACTWQIPMPALVLSSS